MMNSCASTSCFSDATTTETAATATETATGTTSDDDVSISLLYNLSLIQDKVNQIQSLVSFMISNKHHHHNNHDHHEMGSTSLAMTNIGTLVQGIIPAAASMIFTCQQFNIVSNNNDDTTIMELSRQEIDDEFMGGQISVSDQICQNLEWYGTNMNNSSTDIKQDDWKKTNQRRFMEKNCKIVELDADDLLAKFTHYCQICGKGFKRDANLRMHMRAHGDEYKTREALINPINRIQSDKETSQKKHYYYYSCPQEGCRWNQRHERFQPLKSMICVKNHYKRSHCPKMYMCRRCNVKQFSVLSDLRTHEKHCGEVKWVCSCGTRFSRKDKLMSHVALFVGHAPVDATAVKIDHGQM